VLWEAAEVLAKRWIVEELIGGKGVSIDVKLCWERHLVIGHFVILMALDMVNDWGDW
jgi:hypothetical protein